MANIKQQVKRIKTSEKKRLQNASFKSSVKTAIKAVLAKAAAGDKDEAVKAYNLASKKLDKGLAKGIFHKNYVARNKSRLSLVINNIGK